MKLKTWKLKTLLLCFQSLFLSFTILYSYKSLSEENAVGIIASVEKLLKLDQQKLKKLYHKNINNAKNIENDPNIQEVKLHNDIVRSIVLNSNKNYLKYSLNNICKFTSLLENKLLKTSLGIPNNLLVKVTFKNKEKEEVKLTSVQSYINYIYKKKCLTYSQNKKLFSNKNIIKTISTMDFNVSKSKLKCSEQLSSWKKNTFYPYICNISEVIKRGRFNFLKGIENDTTLQYRFLKNNLSYFKRNYIDNTCKYLYNSKKFCSKYTDELVWRDSLNGKKPLYFLSERCKLILNKKSLTSSEIKSCALKLQITPEICSVKKSFNKYAMYPGPNCNEISKVLDHSLLKTNYYDCPGEIKELSLVNIYRLYKHFSKTKSYEQDCVGDTYHTIFNIYEKNKYLKLWPYKICYKDLIKDKKICLSYIPGSTIGNDSEASIISHILQRLKAAPENLICKVVGQSQYNPNLLSYKNGCFIIRNYCTKFECKDKVFYNTKIFNEYTKIHDINSHYFSDNYKLKKISLSDQLLELIKKKEKSILNYTQLTNFITNKKSVIHGLGCLEILAPQIKRSINFNSCTPIPFIVDGYNKKQFTVSIRLANQDVHWPMSIHWDNVFSAVKAYQAYHPEKMWSLNGIF